MSDSDVWEMLTPEQASVVRALLGGPAAWATAAELAEAADLACADAADAIADLVAAGWLDEWRPAPGEFPLLTLSCLTADRLGVVIQDSDQADQAGGGLEALHWHGDAATARPHVSRAARERTEANAGLLLELPDPAADHRDSIEAFDYLDSLTDQQLERYLKGVLDAVWPALSRPRRELWETLPNPTVCVGMSDPCYLPRDDFARRNPRMGTCGVRYEEHLQNGRACKGCGGRDLESYECCPRCSRDGQEGLRNRLIRLAAARDAA